MKTNFKRIGKQSISIVLAVMMMLSTMLVGMVTSNAAISNWVLRGSFNEWNEIQFGGADGGSITYDLSAYKGQTVEFRTDAYENGTLIMNSYGDTVVAGTEYQLTWKKGEPMKYTVSSTGTGKVTFTVISKNGNNYLTVTEGDQPITVTPYYVAGENSLVNGKEWTPEQAEDKMSYDETTKIYSITYDKKAAGTYKFKIIEGSSTWRGHNDFNTVTCTDENCTVSDVDGNNHNIQITTKVEANITITLDSTGKKLTISAEPTTQKYTVAVDKNIKNGTVTPSKTSLAAGDTFTVTAEPNDGYELDAITVKDASDNPINPNSDGSYKMPASNVTVSATFKVKTDAKFSVTYIDPTSSEGVVSASIEPTVTTLAAGLAAGTTVKVTVTVKEGYTASLDVAGANVTTSTSGNTYTFTFSMPAQNITVAPKVTKAGENTGTLIPNLYLIYSDSSSKPSDFTQYLNLYYNSDNQVYAYFDESNFDDSKEYCFMISNSKGESTSWEYAYDHYNNSKTLSDSEQLACGSSDNWLPKAGQSQYVQAVFAKFKVRDAYVGTISSVKINLGYYDGKDIVESSTDSSNATTYEVIPTSGVEGRVQVFAKDGTIRDGYQKYADMADTVLENNADLTKYNNENKYYETAYAKVGTKLKIKTTILPAYREKYFVKAFSINGYSYGIIDASKADTTDGVYTCEYTIPEDFEGKRIEITPIYYYIEEKDTVTFYVEGFDEKVQKMWGNTVAVQAWYANCEKEDDLKNSKFDSPTKNALGGYPGQPLVYEGGKYSMQIPKYLNGEKANYVKGITLNNYFWDDIHKQNFSDKSNTSKFNCQTYDYDDFYKLSESQDVDNIIFDFRYRTTTDKDKEGNKPGVDLNSSTYNKSELEPLKDYSGNIVDIFGNILSEDWTDDYDSKYLTVISDGYKVNEVIGHYATEWSVYDHAGNRIAQINCSSLIDPSKVDPAYQEAYNTLKDYAKLPVKIAYEKSITKGTQLGTRADGRWYFSKKADQISAKVEIEYGADSNSTFSTDEFLPDSNEGKNTGAKAYFTNADYSGKTTCKGTVDGGNFSVHAQTDANAKYYFLGWYLKTSDGYSFITNESDADIPMTNNATYVARFINTPSGTLTLSHTLLSGSADGKTYIKADIVDSNGKVIKSIDETSGNLVIPSSYVTYTSTYKIRLTLRTVPYGNDTVEGFYEGYSSDTPKRYDATFTGTGEQTYSVTRDIKDLFVKINNTDGSVSHNLKKSNIPFYSKITSVPINYQITYTYKTRLNGVQSYVIKDTVSGAELEEMWAANVAAGLPKEQLSKAFITKKAPFVSNYREEIKWNIDAAIIDGYTATVAAVTSTDKLKISALTVGGSWTEPATLEYGTLAMSNGDYLYKTGTTEFPDTIKYSTATDYEFSFWAIFDNREKADQYSKEVAAYMSGTPAEVMSERLTALTKLDGYKNLISKSYSKEYNYISYQDYYIVPVYAGRFAKDQIKESQASIRLLEYTRNQWTNANGVNGNGTPYDVDSKIDYLYTDFALSFDKDQLLIKDNPNIKVGIAFEVVAKYDNVDLKTYVTGSDADTIKTTVKNAKADGKVGSYTFDGADRNVYRYEIKNANISVKNRIEYYLRFKNSETSQQNVMKVYSYIYDTVSGEIYLSDPVYMNMYDIGNLTYITSDLANINLGPDATV